MTAQIVIVSGPPGAGKTTVARAMAERSDAARAVHFHTDDFYGYIRKGHFNPWLIEASAQNAVIAEALKAVAGAFAHGGYEVFADGVVGPWLLQPWLQFARKGAIAVHYVVLRPREEVVVARVVSRTDSVSLKDGDVTRSLWKQFSNLGAYEPHALDTTGESLDETVARLKSALATDRFRLA